MARSRKHSPAGGTSDTSDRLAKRKSGRVLRRRVREALCAGRPEAIPDARLIRDPWDWPKDGKLWYDHDDPRLLRK